METKGHIVKTINAVKSKLRELRQRKYLREEYYKSTYGPLIDPLERLVAKTTTPAAAAAVVPALAKLSPSSKKYDDDDDDTDTEVQLDEEEEEEELLPYKYVSDKPPTPQQREFSPRHPHKESFITDDKTYGIYWDQETGVRMMGNKTFDWDEGELEIGTHRFKNTTGLTELIHSNRPKNYTQDDLDTYYKILGLTMAYRDGYTASGSVKGHGSQKYTQVIKPNMELIKSYSGAGLQKRSLECRQRAITPQTPLSGDPNVLCDRLRLLVASKHAGHTGHDGEINAIIGELRRTKYVQ